MNQIEEYSQTEAAINELKTRWANIPDANTKDGYELIKSGIREVRGFRTSLEKMRVKLKSPIIERGRLLDSEAKRIIAELLLIEKPMADAKKAVDEREEREKAKRIARLQAKIDDIKLVPLTVKGKSSNEIAGAIERLDTIDTTVGFYELTMEAGLVRRDALTELQTMLMDRIGFEAEQKRLKEEAERQAIERDEIEKAQAEIEAARKIIADAEKEKQAKAEKENQEYIAKEAAERAIVEAKEKAIVAAELAKKQQAEAVEVERKRIDTERLAEEEAAKKREANKAHCKKINNAAASRIVAESSVSIEQAALIVKAISQNKITNVSIKY